MKGSACLVPLIAMLCLTGAAMSGSSVVGRYKGGVSHDLTPWPKTRNAQEAKQMRQFKGQLERTVVVVDINKNRTFQLVSTGPLSKRPVQEHGTWKLDDKKLTLTSAKDPKHPVAFVVSSDGRTLTTDLPSAVGMRGKMILKR